MKVEFTNRPLPTHKYSDLKSGDLFTWQHNLILNHNNGAELTVMMVISKNSYVILNEKYMFCRDHQSVGLDNEPVHKLTGTLKVELV